MAHWLYMNAQRKVSWVDPLLVRSHDLADTVCCIFMIDSIMVKIALSVAHRLCGSYLTTTR
jgi:hypothetical protein